MKSTDQPLIIAAEERTREIAYRCQSVERACRWRGFGAGCGYERVATLIARVAGQDTLRRTTIEIAEDQDVNLSERHALRAIEELVKEGVIDAQSETPPPARRRGPRRKIWLLRIDWEAVGRLVAEAESYAAKSRGEVVKTEPVELRTRDRHRSDTAPAKSRHCSDKVSAKSRHFEKHTALYTLTQNPSPSSQQIVKTGTTATRDFEDSESFAAAVDAVRDAGVERVRSLIDLAKSQGMTPTELIDAAYSVTHTPKLTGGALFDFVRCGDWPCSGVKPADVLRDEREQRADEIRRQVVANAPPKATQAAIIGVTVKKLRAAGLREFVGAAETGIFEQLMALRTVASK